MKKMAMATLLMVIFSGVGVAETPVDTGLTTKGDGIVTVERWGSWFKRIKRVRMCDPLMRAMSMCKSSENLLENTK